MQNQQQEDSFLRKLLLTTGVFLLAVVFLLFLVNILSLLPLLFLSVLIALALRGMANQIQRYTPLGHNLSLIAVLLLIIAAFGIGILLLGPSVATQLDEFTETIPRSIEEIRTWLADYQWGQWLVNQMEGVSVEDLNFFSGDTFSDVTGIVSSTFSGLANVFIVLFVGIYMAVEPDIYVDNFIRLFPQGRRPRIREVLAATQNKLRDWMLARLGSMIVVGVLTTIFLTILNMPLALTLGIIAALLSFIPNFGPIIATVPASLIGFTVSAEMGLLYIPATYTLVQQIENNLITPVIERETVSLPPALTMSAQLVLAFLVGQLGFIVAAPFSAMVIVIVRMLYIEDVLGDKVASEEG